jgi:large subunit ribosomal protein L4
MTESRVAETGAVRTVDVLDPQGGTTGSTELPAELFDVTANIPLIHQVVVAQLAAARQGTHSTKTRAEVRGGGTKPHRQKGTGRARQGSIRAPQYVGGGVVHGPTPHGYAQRTPKKMIAAALRGALSDRARDGRIHVVSELVVGETPSTKAALAALAAATTTDKVLVVLERDEDVAWLSLRNAATVHALAVDQLNAYDVLVNDEVVFTSAALATFVSGPVSGRSAKAVATSGEAEELAGSSVEASAEPSNAELAAAAAVVAEVVEPTQDVVEDGAPVVVEVAEVGEPDEVTDVAVVVENEGDDR